MPGVQKKLLKALIREQFQIQTDDVDHYRQKEDQHGDMVDAIICRCEDIAKMIRMNDEDLSGADSKHLNKIRKKYSNHFDDILDALPKMSKRDFDTVPHIWREKISTNPHDYPENWDDVVNMYSTGEHDGEILDAVLSKINSSNSIANLNDSKEYKLMKISESRIRKIVNEELRDALAEVAKPIPNTAAEAREAEGSVWDDDREVINIKTGEITFEWGMYRGRHRDEDYYIDASSSDVMLSGVEGIKLGEIQFRGDPYTYSKKGLSRPMLRVMSGPESGKGMIGRTFNLKGKRLPEVWPQAAPEPRSEETRTYARLQSNPGIGPGLKALEIAVESAVSKASALPKIPDFALADEASQKYINTLKTSLGLWMATIRATGQAMEVFKNSPDAEVVSALVTNALNSLKAGMRYSNDLKKQNASLTNAEVTVAREMKKVLSLARGLQAKLA